MGHNLQAFRKVFRFAAIAATLTSVSFSIAFGFAQSGHWALALACSLFFGVCSVCSDYVVLFIRQAFRERDWGTAITLCLGGAFLFTMNIVGHVGSVGHTRKTEMQGAYLKQASMVDAQKEVANLETAIKLSSGRLADLEKTLKASEEWSVVVSPTGLASQIQNMEGDKIYKRSGECSKVTVADSRTFCDKLNGLRARLADVQVAEGLRKEIKESAERLTRLTEKKQFAQSDAKASANREQAGMFAQLATISLDPGENATEWTVKGLAVYVALGLCICPILFGLIGWGGKEEDVPPQVMRTSVPSVPAPEPVRASEPAPVTAKVEPPKIALVEVTPEPAPVVQRDVQVPLPPRKLQFVGDTAFARRIAGIIRKEQVAA